MSKKSIKKNYIYNLMYQILVMILPLVTTPYLARVLGAENIGIYSYTLSITTYFILFGSLGIAMYGQREIAYVQENVKNRSKIFKEIFLLRLITMTISLIVFYFVFCRNGEYKTYYLIFSLEIIANIFDISWFFQGLEEFKKIVIRNMMVKIISIICIFVFVKTGSDLIKYILIYAVSVLLGNISLWLYIPKYIIKVKYSQINIVRHLKPTLLLFVPQVAVQIYTVLDKTMIGALVLDKSEVGFYEQAQKIVKMCLTLATSLGTVMIPRIASTFSKGDTKKLGEYMNNSFSFIMILAFPIMFGLISIAKSFVPIFFGPGYDKVSILICTISPIIVAIGLSTVIGTQYLMPTKQQNKLTISVVCGAIINIILNFALIKKYGAIGASVSTVIAEFTVAFIQFYLVRNKIKIFDVVKISYKYFFAAIGMFIASLIVGNVIKNALLSIAFQVICGSLVYFLLLLLWKDEFFINNIKLIKVANIFHNKKRSGFYEE